VTSTDPVSTREAILDAALTAFSRRGYDGVSIAEIAGEVGIAKASLVHHFPTKESLYREVFSHAMVGWATVVEEAVHSEGPTEGWSQVDHVVSAGFRFFEQNRDFVRLVRWEALSFDSHLGVDLGAALRPMFERAVNHLTREMGEGNLRKLDPEQLVISGLGAVLSYFSDLPFIEGLLGRDPLDPELLQARLDHIRDLFRMALEP
jgi:TetR/AcrR family transcriptional regulator